MGTVSADNIALSTRRIGVRTDVLHRLQDAAAEHRNWDLVRDVNWAIGGDALAFLHCVRMASALGVFDGAGETS